MSVGLKVTEVSLIVAPLVVREEIKKIKRYLLIDDFIDSTRIFFLILFKFRAQLWIFLGRIWLVVRKVLNGLVQVNLSSFLKETTKGLERTLCCKEE